MLGKRDSRDVLHRRGQRARSSGADPLKTSRVHGHSHAPQVREKDGFLEHRMGVKRWGDWLSQFRKGQDDGWTAEVERYTKAPGVIAL